MNFESNLIQLGNQLHIKYFKIHVGREGIFCLYVTCFKVPNLKID